MSKPPLSFVIRKKNLNTDQLKLIGLYKARLLPEGAVAEEYSAGFKFYYDPSMDSYNIREYFKALGIETIPAELFREEWCY